MKLPRVISCSVLLCSLFTAGSASAMMAGTTFNTDFSNFTIGGAFNAPIASADPGIPGPASALGGTLTGGMSLIGEPSVQALSEFVFPSLITGPNDQFDFSVAGAPVNFSGATFGAGGPANTPFTAGVAPLYHSGNTALIIGAGDSVFIDFTDDVIAASFTVLNIATSGAFVDFQVAGDDIEGVIGGGPFGTENVFLSVDDAGIIDNIRLTNLSETMQISIDNFSFTTASPAPVPVPAAAWLFISAVGGLLTFARKK